ncbi:ethanolamine utilization protein EutJ [Desulfitispora alkaliphila]|uniref:ethanolamine utilization protein EutJ n=1 Tax=Desulfitispora alkaliphila TaxID=622674 RepID=UPI003D1D0501
MASLSKANELIRVFEEKLSMPAPVKANQKLYTGIDLGTAYIVMTVINQLGEPVAGAMRFAQVVKDGLVVDYIGALDIVRELKAELEEELQCELEIAGSAYPPGTSDAVIKTIGYISEGAGFRITTMIDEPTAANKVLGVWDGAIVDIGGGTTGTCIVKGGQVVHIVDDPTGGTHLSLVIAGQYKVKFEEAEELKKDPEKFNELMPSVKPVMQKMGMIVKEHIRGFDVDEIFLAGGTSCFKGIDKVIEGEIGIPVNVPSNPFLVTPLGIALSIPRD